MEYDRVWTVEEGQNLYWVGRESSAYDPEKVVQHMLTPPSADAMVVHSKDDGTTVETMPNVGRGGQWDPNVEHQAAANPEGGE